MNPWVRVLLLFVAAVAAAMFLKLLPPVIVLVAVVGGVVAINLRLKGRVKRERATLRSEGDGLRLERGDPCGLLSYPFALFGRRDRAEVDGIRWGTWHALEVKRFDLTCPPGDGYDGTRFACAIAPAAYVMLPLVVESVRLADLLTVPALQSVDVEGLPADRWVVRCGDPALAAALLGPSMVAWLSELEKPWGFEMSASLALAYGPASAGIEEPLERLEAFSRLIEEAGQRRAGPATVSERPDPAS
jgi:hypothetical protein